jgi:hypothetical protein
MVWVFLACALQCLAAGGGCTEAESLSCCRQEVDDPCTPSLGDVDASTCFLVPDDPLVLSGRIDIERSHTHCDAAAGALIAVAERSDEVPPCCASPPGRPRPLDRLPELRI